MHKERLTLATIGGGAVQERVDRALEKVAKNIMDPNTDPGEEACYHAEDHDETGRR